MLTGIMAVILAPILMLLALGVAAVIDLLLAIPLKMAWNYAIPALFHLPAITYWQAFCLLVITGLLIKNCCVSSPTNKD